MFHGPLEESWAYREIIEKGIEQGIEQGELKALRPVLVRIVERRFAELTPLAQQRVERITSPALLSSLIDRLFTLQTLEQARQMLMEIEQAPDTHS